MAANALADRHSYQGQGRPRRSINPIGQCNNDRSESKSEVLRVSGTSPLSTSIADVKPTSREVRVGPKGDIDCLSVDLMSISRLIAGGGSVPFPRFRKTPRNSLCEPPELPNHRRRVSTTRYEDDWNLELRCALEPTISYTLDVHSP